MFHPLFGLQCLIFLPRQPRPFVYNPCIRPALSKNMERIKQIKTSCDKIINLGIKRTVTVWNSMIRLQERRRAEAGASKMSRDRFNSGRSHAFGNFSNGFINNLRKQSIYISLPHVMLSLLRSTKLSESQLNGRSFFSCFYKIRFKQLQISGIWF